MNMNDVNFDAMYCLFKGDPGLRKSTQALSFPQPSYWFSWDRKMNALKIPMRAWNIDPKQIQYDDYDDWTKARTKLEKFQLECPFRTLVIDSITSCGDSIMRQMLKMKYGATRKSGADAGKSIGGIAVNELEDFNAESSALHELISLTKDIHKFHKVNIVLIAHVISIENTPIGGKTTISRSIVTAARKIAAKIPAYCDEVYHFDLEKSFDESKGGEIRILTTHTGTDFARTTLPLPESIKFGTKPLYDTWIKPAITQITQPQPT
jgi:hypothetical protein